MKGSPQFSCYRGRYFPEGVETKHRANTEDTNSDKHCNFSLIFSYMLIKPTGNVTAAGPLCLSVCL